MQLSAYLTILIGVIPSMCAGVLATFAVTLIFKTSYTTNFAQGVISALGAYVAVEFTLVHGYPLWMVCPYNQQVPSFCFEWQKAPLRVLFILVGVYPSFCPCATTRAKSHTLAESDCHTR